ncbi:class I SAM-dependent methyltransferase [Tepidicaulis sp. LMO-SS28]|uniref:class I SAM-dependent methyltransferase n=1 Tax=Tepidicaulis sp. LMO-SS28 TaxID=3447455 RepID=UPI003EDF184E
MDQPRKLNQDQIDYWNGDVGETWTRQQEKMDAVLGPITDAVLEAAAAKRGERVLDIGCGCGDTTLMLAREGAKVSGVDVSAPMIARAQDRFAEEGLEAELLTADAAAHPFTPGSFDLVFSRFGVMFFEDPAAAFANIRQGMKEDGRLAFVCWRDLGENPWLTAPMQAILPFITPPEPPVPGAPGPGAFADPARVKDVLGKAGFKDIALAPFDTPLVMGSGPNAVADALALTLEIGPVARALKDEPAAREKALPALEAFFAEHETPEGIKLGSATWMVTARG